jgi:hypothetical protein
MILLPSTLGITQQLAAPKAAESVHTMFAECSLNVPWMFLECSLNVPWMFLECSLNVPWMFPDYDGGTDRVNTEFYSWDTSFGLVNPRLRYSCLQVVFCFNLGTFFKCFLQLGWRLTGVRSTHTECSLNIPWMGPECSLILAFLVEVRDSETLGITNISMTNY